MSHAPHFAACANCHGRLAHLSWPTGMTSVLASAQASEDSARRLLLHDKNDLAAPPPGLAYRIEQMPIEKGIWASRIAWDTETSA
jgi:hypothetical protein